MAAGGGLAGGCRKAFSSASSVGHGPCSAIRPCAAGSRAARPMLGAAFNLAFYQPSARSGPLFEIRFAIQTHGIEKLGWIGLYEGGVGQP